MFLTVDCRRAIKKRETIDKRRVQRSLPRSCSSIRGEYTEKFCWELEDTLFICIKLEDNLAHESSLNSISADRRNEMHSFLFTLRAFYDLDGVRKIFTNPSPTDENDTIVAIVFHVFSLNQFRENLFESNYYPAAVPFSLLCHSSTKGVAVRSFPWRTTAFINSYRRRLNVITTRVEFKWRDKKKVTVAATPVYRNEHVSVGLSLFLDNVLA